MKGEERGVVKAEGPVGNQEPSKLLPEAALRGTPEGGEETEMAEAMKGADEGALATEEEANTFCAWNGVVSALVAENKKGCCCWGALSLETACWV